MVHRQDRGIGYPGASAKGIPMFGRWLRCSQRSKPPGQLSRQDSKFPLSMGECALIGATTGAAVGLVLVLFVLAYLVLS
jgi:hypothetical protein